MLLKRTKRVDIQRGCSLTRPDVWSLYILATWLVSGSEAITVPLCSTQALVLQWLLREMVCSKENGCNELRVKLLP